ncbi:hypothetical protein M0805_003261 [Coniferiporia weirii]|nr:hypothetical protein M0805_003261 [Coniferiporia weirii]
MFRQALALFVALATSSLLAAAAIAPQGYDWANVKIGGGGGFVPGIIFNPSEEGLAYIRTDIGGAYRLNSDDTWTPLLDFVDNDRWAYWGVDALATDPVDTNNVYLATGMYTNSWDPNNGHILISTDKGDTWTASELPFKVGGNMPGRGMGERLAVDPHENSILFFGARSGNGLWKSADSGATWSKVSSFTTPGTYVPDPTDTTGYNSDILGVSFVTFDSTSGTSGTATPRIFVGVASLGEDNIFVSEDAGETWSAVAGQNNTFIPHKGVLSPAENTLYVSYSNGGGPYDGTLGSVYKYDISSAVWTDITPVSGSDLYFGFGGLAVDIQTPGTIMVAALNSWWPDGQIFRSNDSGTTWSPLWSWASYPNINKWYKYDDSLAPWLGPDYDVTTLGTLQIGWMMEFIAIDPFDSDHWLYGTGSTVYGGRDLTTWDTTHNVTLKSLADGMEETAIQALLSPPTGPNLLSAMLDLEGFVHNSLTTPPLSSYTNPSWSGAVDLDYAGNDPATIVRIGNGDSTSGKQVAISTDSGASWAQDYGAADNVTSGKVALSANADTVLWRTSANGVQVSQYTNAFVAVPTLPDDAQIASDKVNNSIFYGASGSQFYISEDGGKTFASTATLGSSTAPAKVIVHPSVSGDIWVSTDVGIFHSLDFGSTWSQLAGVTEAWSISLGAPKTTGGYPALFAIAAFGSQSGYFRSDDAGLNWAQINDEEHGFGSFGANVISGDPRIYGRVYVGTNGRGIFYGDATGVAPPATVTSTSTSTTATSKSTSTAAPTTSSASGSTVVPTSSSSTITSSNPSATQSVWGQCGGIGYTGPTVCASGSTCTFNSDYYSQCIPN